MFSASLHSQPCKPYTGNIATLMPPGMILPPYGHCGFGLDSAPGSFDVAIPEMSGKAFQAGRERGQREEQGVGALNLPCQGRYDSG